MGIFKEKKSRNKNIKSYNRITLDAKHNLKIKSFQDLLKSINKYKKILKNKIEKYNKISTKSNLELNDEELETKLELKESIETLKTKIIEIENNKCMNKYLLQTSQILYQYYDSNNNSSETTTKIKKNSLIQKELSVVDFFTKNASIKNASKNKANIKNNELEIKTPIVINPKLNKNFNKNSNKNYSKNDILNEYMKITDKNYVTSMNYINSDVDYCEKCNMERMFYQTEGVMVCPKCGTQEKILVDSDKPSYKEPPREISYFAYKRINHFNEWLAQFQAKESTDIPREVYEKIKSEIKKESYINTNNLKISKIRDILKKLSLNKYYEHVPHIMNRLSGKPAPIITRKVEEKLRMMFKEIQVPWMKHCPDKRSNFLSYSYVLYKCLQLLEMDEFLKHFSLLKSREKLAEQDTIWRLICNDLKWQFIKTI